jgi:hypothetical protein
MNIDDSDDENNEQISNNKLENHKYRLRNINEKFPTLKMNELINKKPFMPMKIYTLQYQDNKLYRNLFKYYKRIIDNDQNIFINNYDKNQLYGVNDMNYIEIRNRIMSFLDDINQNITNSEYSEKQVAATPLGDVIVSDTNNHIIFMEPMLIYNIQQFKYPFRIIDFKYDFQRMKLLYDQTGTYLITFEKFEPLNILYSIFRMIYNSFNLIFNNIEQVFYSQQHFIITCNFVKSTYKNIQVNIIFPNKTVLTIQDAKSIDANNTKYIPPIILLLDKYESQITIEELINALLLMSHVKLRDATISYIRSRLNIKDFELADEMLLNNQNLQKLQEMQENESHMSLRQLFNLKYN